MTRPPIPTAADGGPADDGPLRRALQHAPDHDLRPSPALRQALQQAARRAAATHAAERPPSATPPRPTGRAPGWRVWLAWLGQPATLGAVASLAVMGLSLHLWWSVQGEAPETVVAEGAAADQAPPAAVPAQAHDDAKERLFRSAASEVTSGRHQRSIARAPDAPAAEPSDPAEAALARSADPAPARAAVAAPDVTEVADRRMAAAPAAAAPVEPGPSAPPSAAGADRAVAAAPLPRSALGATAGRPERSAERSAPQALPARPAPLQQLADALAAPEGPAAGWTVAGPGDAPRPLDPARRLAWRLWITQTDGGWPAPAEGPGAAEVRAEGPAAAVWTVVAPDGTRFELRLQADTLTLVQPPAGDGAVRIWRATRPGGWPPPPR